MAALVSISKLLEVEAHLRAHGCTYQMGSKAPALDCDTALVHSIDCSGFARYAIAKATGQQLIIPDGSQTQWEWAKHHGLTAHPYHDVATAAGLFICFMAPRVTRGAHHAGHVWMVHRGMTVESWGGPGPDRRRWDTPVLLQHCGDCFELPSEA